VSLTRLLFCLFIIFTLFGCGGGSSSSGSSSPPAGTQTTFSIANPSAVNYAKASIVADDGNVIYDNLFDCPASQNSCYINLTSLLNKPVNLLFKDSSGRLQSAFHANPQGDAYIDVYPSSVSTGIYLMKRLSSELVASDGISWEDLGLRTATFFTNYNSADGDPNNFQELGEYYAAQLLASPSLTENQFLANFRLRLLNWDVAKSNELPKSVLASTSYKKQLYIWAVGLINGSNPSIIASAHANSSSCSEGLSWFLSFANNLGGYVPIVGDAVAGTAGIAQDYCDGTDVKLDRILAKLETLQNSVDAVGSRLGVLTEFLSDKTANQQTTNFQQLQTSTQHYKSTYKKFLQDNNVTNLVAYFNAKGGWTQAITAGGNTLKSIMYSPYVSPSDTGMIGKLLGTTSTANFNTYLAALNVKCDSLSQSQNNFLAVRQNCNNIIASNSAMLVGSQGAMIPMIKDIYAVLDQYKDFVQTNGAPVRNDYPPYSSLSSYDIEGVKTLFKNQQTDLIAKQKSAIPGVDGYFNAFTGLDDGLMKKMVSRDCAQVGSDRASSPAIVGWYSPKSDARQNYIVTNCKGDDSKLVKARYYYLDQGSADVNDVSNVLGVLLASQYVAGNTVWMYNNSSSSYTYAYDVPKYPNFKLKGVTGVNAAQARYLGNSYVVKSAGAGSQSSPKGILIGPLNGDPNMYSANLFDGVLTVYNYNWVAFKDSAGFNYAIYLPLGGRNGSDWGYGYMYCMSSDCSVNSDGKTLAFKNGPQAVNFFAPGTRGFDFQLTLD